MATIVDVQGVTRANAYWIPVEQLEQKEDSRRWSDQDVKELAEDIIDRGQLVPVLVTWDKTEEGRERLVVVEGRRRVAAIRYINDQGWSKDDPLKTLCVHFKGATDTTFETAAVLNIKRKGLSPIDLAHTISTLEKSGKTRKEIAKLLEVSEALISQTLRLPTLPVAIQKAIHKGEISASAGYEMASLNQEDQAKTVTISRKNPRHRRSPPIHDTPESLRDTQHRPTRAADDQPPATTPSRPTQGTKTTRESVRAMKRERAEKGEAVSGSVARSRKVVYNELSEFAGCDDGSIEEPVKKVFAALVKYMDGKTGIRAVLNQLRELAGTE